MTINLESPTDAPEAVTAALGSPGQEKPPEADPKSAPEPSKEAPEQKEPSESETEETDPKETPDESTEAEPDKDAAAADDSTKAKGKGGFQRRIGKITAQKAAAEKRATEAERERDYLRTLVAQPNQKPSTPAVTAPAAEVEPKSDDYATHAEYVRALARLETKQQLSAYDASKAKETVVSAHQQRVNTFVEREKAFAAKTDDYQEVLEDINFPPVLNDIFIRHENGPQLAYALASDRTEFERIVALNPVDAAREFGKFEARVFPNGSAEKKPETKKTTEAPTPLKPVGAKGGPVEKDPEKMNYQEWKQWRHGQIKAAEAARR